MAFHFCTLEICFVYKAAEYGFKRNHNRGAYAPHYPNISLTWRYTATAVICTFSIDELEKTKSAGKFDIITEFDNFYEKVECIELFTSF